MPQDSLAEFAFRTDGPFQLKNRKSDAGESQISAQYGSQRSSILSTRKNPHADILLTWEELPSSIAKNVVRALIAELPRSM